MTKITINSNISAPINKIWEYYTQPKHITQWNNASSDWHTPNATNDLKVGGKFLYRMEAKDGSHGFDFFGTYTEVTPTELIKYTMGDNREVEVTFSTAENSVLVTLVFDAETTNSIDMQKNGWQSILDNFKSYVENN